jgi:PTS system nitrogen regulatory IIA component
MKISDFLSLADVMVDIRASDKRQLLQELARKAASRLNIPADPVAAELLKREELGSTGTGGGIAIPHARIKAVTKSFGIMARLREPIEFDAIDSEPVDLIFLLLLPTTADGEQLDALSSIARRLRASEILVQLRGAKNAAELYSAIVG